MHKLEIKMLEREAEEASEKAANKFKEAEALESKGSDSATIRIAYAKAAAADAAAAKAHLKLIKAIAKSIG